MDPVRVRLVVGRVRLRVALSVLADKACPGVRAKAVQHSVIRAQLGLAAGGRALEIASQPLFESAGLGRIVPGALDPATPGGESHDDGEDGDPDAGTIIPKVTVTASWRIVIVSQAPPAAFAIDAMCRDAGHRPVAIVTSRRTHGDSSNLTAMLDGAPPDVDVLYLAHKRSLAPLFRAYEPDLVICLGFPWLMPQEALDVPKLGAINVHPSKLPLYRGPIPLPWAVRNGETEIALTVHRMEAEFDTGAILAQAPVPVDPAAWTFEEVIPHFQAALQQIIPRALERIAAGDEGEPQEGDPGVYAAWFEDEFRVVDWSKPAPPAHR
jgi:methionyl-tRNA formyltransferase